MSTVKPVTERARTAIEYAELMERVGMARAAVEDVHRQITKVQALRGPAAPFMPAANARTCAYRAHNELALVARLVESMDRPLTTERTME